MIKFYYLLSGKIATTWVGTKNKQKAMKIMDTSSCLESPTYENLPLSPPLSAHYATANIAKYASYLQSLYKARNLPICQKWPPTPSKKYINLVLIKKDDSSLSEAYEFTSAKLHGSIDRILKKKEPIFMYQVMIPDSESSIKCILVEGAPGVGKSTFAWELCRNWDTLPLFNNYSLVILIQLREKRAQQANNLSDLLYHRNSTLKAAVANDIEESDGEGVLFIFDGFDELRAEQRAIGSLFVDIINGLYLPKATVLVTSRPSVTAELIARCKPQISKHIEILGFTEQNIREYAHSVFQNAEQLDDFLKYISGNPLLHSMMYIPLNTAIVVAIYQQSKPAELPKTMTQLYDALSHTLLRRHIVEKAFVPESYIMPAKFHNLPTRVFQQFCNVSKLAFDGVCIQQLTWNDLPESFDHLGFMTKATSLHVEEGPETTFNFLHLTCQEFLAAFYISLLQAEEQKKIFEQYSSEGHFQVVWWFLAGLTSFNSLSWEAVKAKSQDNAPNWLGADYCLKLLAIHCLYESQDTAACRELYNSAEKVGFLPDTASPFDCFALSYCITNSKCKWVIDLINAGVNCDTLEMFVKGLSKQPSGQIEALKLGKSDLGRQGMKYLAKLPPIILEQMPILKLYNCGLDGSACDQLSEVIPMVTNLKELDLGVNPVGSGGTVKLIQSLSGLTYLHLLDIANVTLGCADIQALSSLIKQPSTIKTIKIGDDEMTSECIEQMLHALFEPTSLQKLEIRDSDLTGSSSTIHRLLESNMNLEVLEFLWCKLGETVAESIALALHHNSSLSVLKIRHPSLGLKPQGAKAFAQMLQVNVTLTELTIQSDSSLGDGASELLKSNHSLRNLKVLNE